MSVYDLILVKMKESDTYARPSDFEYDNDSNPIKITKAVTTCPSCGGYNEIIMPDTYREGDVINHKCTVCDEITEKTDEHIKVEIKNQPIVIERKKKGPIIKEIINPKINIQENKELKSLKNEIQEKQPIVIENKINQKVEIGNIITEANENGLKPNCTFVDPIVLGLFTVDEI
jgi:hypothetical protein